MVIHNTTLDIYCDISVHSNSSVFIPEYLGKRQMENLLDASDTDATPTQVMRVTIHNSQNVQLGGQSRMDVNQMPASPSPVQGQQSGPDLEQHYMVVEGIREEEMTHSCGCGDQSEVRSEPTTSAGLSSSEQEFVGASVDSCHSFKHNRSSVSNGGSTTVQHTPTVDRPSEYSFPSLSEPETALMEPPVTPADNLKNPPSPELDLRDDPLPPYVSVESHSSCTYRKILAGESSSESTMLESTVVKKLDDIQVERQMWPENQQGWQTPEFCRSNSTVQKNETRRHISSTSQSSGSNESFEKTLTPDSNFECCSTVQENLDKEPKEKIFHRKNVGMDVHPVCSSDVQSLRLPSAEHAAIHQVHSPENNTSQLAEDVSVNNTSQLAEDVSVSRTHALSAEDEKHPLELSLGEQGMPQPAIISSDSREEATSTEVKITASGPCDAMENMHPPVPSPEKDNRKQTMELLQYQSQRSPGAEMLNDLNKLTQVGERDEPAQLFIPGSGSRNICLGHYSKTSCEAVGGGYGSAVQTPQNMDSSSPSIHTEEEETSDPEEEANLTREDTNSAAETATNEDMGIPLEMPVVQYVEVPMDTKIQSCCLTPYGDKAIPCDAKAAVQDSRLKLWPYPGLLYAAGICLAAMVIGGLLKVKKQI